MSDESLNILTTLLLKKFGKEKIEGLLTDEWCIDKTRPEGRTAYTRDLQHRECLFCDGEDHHLSQPCNTEWKIGPETLLWALEDARNEFNYSNWMADKLDTTSEIVIRYCEENDIPIDYTRRRHS